MRKKDLLEAKESKASLKRRRHIDPSRHFQKWASQLDLEKSPLGRLILWLDQFLYFRQVFFLFVFSVLVSVFVFYELDLSYKTKVGQVATQDIKSPISFEVVDEDATQAKKEEAEKSVLPVFDYDEKLFDSIYAKVTEAFQEMRKSLSKEKLSKPFEQDDRIRVFVRTKKKEFEKILGLHISPATFEWLVEKRFSPSIERSLLRVLEEWLDNKIVANKLDLNLAEGHPDVISVLPVSGKSEGFTLSVKELKEVGDTSYFNLKNLRYSRFLRGYDRKQLLKLARTLLAPNLTFNMKETLRRREKAKKAVLPVIVSIKKGQTIVAAGTKVQPSHRKILKKIEAIKKERRSKMIYFSTALLFMVVALTFFSYLRRFTLNKVKVSVKDLVVMGVVTLIVVLMTKVFLFVTQSSLISLLGKDIISTAFIFAAPVAAGPMLVGLLISSGEVVWLYTIFQSIVLSFLVDMNFPFFITSIIGGIAGARGVFACKKRNDIYFAGLRTGMVNFIVIVFLMVFYESQNSSWSFGTISLNAFAGFVGGILSSLVAMMLIPLLESVFHYTTDIKLLELANLNHPLMTQMMMKAPGTYHHCLSVGNMVEAAAQEIGANSLLAKVMAMYHDIGKMEHPQYFAENQKKGYNPHDQLSPYMSKTVLIAHVKDGAEMAIEHKLGKPILDGILQHHGTSLISYFYNRAVEESDGETTVDENDFRYPGPKPQFKEAALVMLADSIEATARSLEEPTPLKLQNIVKNIIQGKFIDGQLDECNLTLKDLSVIEKAFKKVLLAIYHQRMEYPHMKEGRVIRVPQPKNSVAKNQKKKTQTV